MKALYKFPSKIMQGATRQLRFQPGHEKLLATASGNMINLFDVETSGLLLSFKVWNSVNWIWTFRSRLKFLQLICWSTIFLQGHVKDVLSISWDFTGEYLLSVSEESARLWSMRSGGKCIYELHASEKRFQSCIFHPGYQNLGIIGSHKVIQQILWFEF